MQFNHLKRSEFIALIGGAAESQARLAAFAQVPQPAVSNRSKAAFPILRAGSG